MTDTGEDREVESSDRMSSQEALMWNVEKDPWLNPSGAGLFVFDQPLDVDLLRSRMRNAVAGLPRLYERVQPGLGRLAPPVWVPDPEFDFDHHLRVVHLPSPGTERQLFDLAARLYVDPLDRTRPLWRMVVIDGLEGGRGALWTLIHHVISDGIGQLRMAELFQDVERDVPASPEIDLEAIVAAEVEARRAKEQGGDLGSSLAGTVVGSAGHLMRRTAGIARRAAGEVAIWPADPRRATETVAEVAGVVADAAGQLTAGRGDRSGAPLWTDRSRHRHLEHVAVPLDELKVATKAVGASINDGFVAALAHAAVAYHVDRGVSFETLNTSFVVSTRTDHKAGGNAFTPVPVQVPADDMTIRSRVGAVRAILSEARERVDGGASLASMAGVINLLPTSVVTRTARAEARHIDIATSNLRGAPFPLYVAGAKVLYGATMGPLAGTPCNATALSYQNAFDIGLFMDPAAIGNPGEFRQCVDDAFGELLALA